MGNKVEMTEVVSFSDELKSAASSLKSQLDAIKKSTNQIAEMNSFTGLTADSAKDYLKDFHMKIADNFTTLFESLSTQLSSHIVSFQSEVDSSNAAHLDSDYLKDEQTKVSDQYSKVSESHSNLKATIQKISDISSLKPPSLSEAAKGKKTAVQILQKTEDKLHNFTTKGKKDAAEMDELLDQLEAILKDVGKMDKGNRFSEYYNGSINENVNDLKRLSELYDKGKTIVTTVLNSYPLVKVAMKAGLKVRVIRKNGKRYHQIEATREALQILGIEPDSKAEEELSYRLPKKRKLTPKDLARAKSNTATLKYKAFHKNSLVWTETGKKVIQKYQSVGFLSGKINLNYYEDWEYASKTIGLAAVKGASDSLKEAVDVSSIVKSAKNLRGFGKALGPLGAGLSFYSNYHDALDDGLNNKKAAVRASLDTVIDTAIGGSVQTAFTTAGTVLIPIPGVGTVVGFGLGLLVNWYLNKRSKDNYNREKKDSVIDKLKSWYH
ncbi:T7SS effector LXG polymorphic toxin [Heyndrickxia coagulans]|uniref:T7SS effector LXG polymorphic toxin n=1 Tax=Heyndrickxia coagulans TaxID=1398 RepID=UPI001A946316|nr:T7SS effector LXG polymorphic toxin [Heyndrickxia coagulans]